MISYCIKIGSYKSNGLDYKYYLLINNRYDKSINKWVKVDSIFINKNMYELLKQDVNIKIFDNTALNGSDIIK